MRIYRLVLAILTLVQPLAVLSASSADAASFDVEVHASQEAPSGSSNSSDVDEETTATSPAAASLVFSGSSSAFGLPQRTGTTTASGSATSKFDASGLELGVVTTSRVSGVTDGLGPFDYRATTNALATFVDAITVTGGTPGTKAYIRVVFSLDGTMASKPISSATPKSRADLLVWVFDALGGFNLMSLSSVNGSAVSVPSQAAFLLEYTFDDPPAPFSVSMQAATFGFLASSAQNVTQTVDFGSTLRFVLAEVLELVGDPPPEGEVDERVKLPVLGGRIVSASGLVYPHGPLDHIVVSPAGATISAGGSKAYTAEGFDTNGNSLGALPGATFSITPNGSCTGATCTATVAGSHTVTGHASGKTATAALTVNPGPLHHLTLSPAGAAIIAGGSQAYTTEGFDAFNNSLGDMTGATTFSITPNGSCTGATCGATVAGPHTVSGSASGKTGAAALTVNPGPLDHLTLSPASVTTTAGGSQGYTAQGADAFNNSLGAVTGATVFSIAPDGSCTGATCTATVVGPHTVTGNDAGKTGTASLTVIAGPPRADLAVTAVDNPHVTIKFFGKISAHDTVKNQGTAQANASRTRYYLSADQTRGGGDKLLLGQRLVGALSPGQSSTGGVALFVFGVPAGTYYVIACADDKGTTVESDEGNNCLTSATQVVIQ